jgi:hypothetical protein
MYTKPILAQIYLDLAILKLDEIIERMKNAT